MAIVIDSEVTKQRNDIARKFLGGGIAFSLIGLVAVALPAMATIAIDLMIGFLLIVAGVTGFALLRGTGGVFTSRNTGILFGMTLVAGILLVVFPFEGSRVLTLMLIGLFAVEGAVMSGVGYRVRTSLPGGRWMMANGALTLLLAIAIAFGWPASGLQAIGLLFGINLLITGFSLIMMGLAFRRD